MFTGIVQQMGRVQSREPVDFGAILRVDSAGWAHRPSPGDSISVNGCCLTVGGEPGEPSEPGPGLRFDVIRQTLEATTLGDLGEGDPVNLEHAVTPTTLLGGHLVSGHIDGVAKVEEVRKSDQEWVIRLRPPADLMEYVIDKGSVTLAGVSLTVAGTDYEGGVFEVALIPTTLSETTLGGLHHGDRINIETDQVVKTVIHWLRRSRAGVPPVSKTES